jgi:hypothetical protein
MRYYRFQADGFRSSYDFCKDDDEALRVGFETAVELTRSLGHLVFVTVYDSAGALLARVPHLPGHAMPAPAIAPEPSDI